MNYNSYFGNLLAATSQWFNSLFGGYRDVSISGRVGFYYQRDGALFWKICKFIIDTTFYPIEDKGDHCVDAFKRDTDELYSPLITRGNEIFLGFLLIFVLLICIPIAIGGWLIYLIKKLF